MKLESIHTGRTTGVFARAATALVGLAALGLTTLSAASALAQSTPSTLRVVITGELRSIDPVWTTAQQTRYHAFMVYDTLFGLDEKQEVRPQMVDRYDISADKLTYTFVLRDNLKFSDGAPVTAEDVVVSWKRWAETDAAGQVVATFLSGLDVVDAKTFKAVLKEPLGQLLYALAKPMAMPLYVMPARIARGVPGTQQINDPTGSGPFIMKRDEWVAGSKVVYVKNPNYVPRAEPASGIAGGKRVLVDRVEWINIPDQATQAAALQRGEVDLVEQPATDLLPVLQKAAGIEIDALLFTGTQGTMRVNHTYPPFDKPEIRKALQNFVLQDDMLMAVLGDSKLGRPCGALLVCGTPNASEWGTELLLSKDSSEVRLKRGMEMLKKAGYAGEKIIIMDPLDQPVMHGATLVLVDAMRKAGVNVDYQAMDWATLVTRRSIKGPVANGWHIFFTTGNPANPAFHIQMSAACDKAVLGWPCDAEMERLRAAWVRESDPVKAFKLAEDIQRRGMEISIYIPYGQYKPPSAWRSNLQGILKVPETLVFWNIAKK